MIRRATFLLPVLLAACAQAPVRGPDAPTVRHFESTETAGNGARWHIFLFDPSEPRDLDDRIALARAFVRAEGRCTWVGAPRDDLARQTAAQGARYAETMLAAPLRCTA
ncbi:hypothetical protein E2L08_04380 [Palleronia sediminis]|uniref:Lipoprotein n=1 Tax=Palleronia sediminis TaxID=2547833 RepID=A0A4R6AFD3_9RHOB|nr:hypothetical protein [Palleronia sediminis]TDL81895.1 hypothetical protein E2L08_04380 [Palleronia sediminis]